MNTKPSNREQLKELSAWLTMPRDTGIMTSDLKKVYSITDALNTNALIKAYYQTLGACNLKTFKQWKEDGFFVQKGEKAYIIWATPHDINKSKQGEGEANDKKKAQQESTEYEDKKRDFFPICHLFDISQVKPANPDK